MSQLRCGGAFLLAVLFGTAFWVALAQEEERDPKLAVAENLPPGPGMTLVLEACVQCHDLRAIVTQRKSEADWRRSVNEMVWRGAPLMPGEAEVLTRYLATAFGPATIARASSPPRRMTTQNDTLAKYLPTGTGRRLVLDTCVQCHDLMIMVVNRKTPAAWHRSVEQMAQLGARLNGNEIALVADYLAEAFGPDDLVPPELLAQPFTFQVTMPQKKRTP